MNWIRIAVAISDDPDIHRVADALDIRVAEAVGLVVSTLCKFPEHAPDGNLTDIPPTLVERWAGWEGDRGKFHAALSEFFLNAEATWESWEKHNGAAMREAEASRARARKYRTERLETDTRTPYGTPNGSPYGSLDRSPLRTDGRTNQTTGGRKRPIVENPAPNSPWCVECQGVVVTQPNGMPKKVHTPECSRA